VGHRNDVMNNTQRRFLRWKLIFLDNTLISAFSELAKREMSKRINYGRLVLWLHSIHNDMCRWINTDGQPQPENLDPPHAGEDARASGVRMPPGSSHSNVDNRNSPLAHDAREIFGLSYCRIFQRHEHRH